MSMISPIYRQSAPAGETKRKRLLRKARKRNRIAKARMKEAIAYAVANGVDLEQAEARTERRRKRSRAVEKVMH